MPAKDSLLIFLIKLSISRSPSTTYLFSPLGCPSERLDLNVVRNRKLCAFLTLWEISKKPDPCKAGYKSLAATHKNLSNPSILLMFGFRL